MTKPQLQLINCIFQEKNASEEIQKTIEIEKLKCYLLNWIDIDCQVSTHGLPATNMDVSSSQGTRLQLTPWVLHLIATCEKWWHYTSVEKNTKSKRAFKMTMFVFWCFLCFEFVDPNSNPGANYQVQAWTYRSSPCRKSHRDLTFRHPRSQSGHINYIFFNSVLW